MSLSGRSQCGGACQAGLIVSMWMSLSGLNVDEPVRQISMWMSLSGRSKCGVACQAGLNVQEPVRQVSVWWSLSGRSHGINVDESVRSQCGGACQVSMWRSLSGLNVEEPVRSRCGGACQTLNISLYQFGTKHNMALIPI